jgi:hypothetical protein
LFDIARFFRGYPAMLATGIGWILAARIGYQATFLIAAGFMISAG